MKQLFLTSSVDSVAQSVADKIVDIKDRSLVFITTPIEGEDGDDFSWADDDRNAMISAGFKVTDYTITGKNLSQIKQDLNTFEVIYVSGGNSYYFLDQARQTGFDSLIIDWVSQGKVYIGTSCGSIVAGKDIQPAAILEDVTKAPSLKDTKGFGLINFAILPHWGSDSFRSRYLQAGFEHTYNRDTPIMLLSDYQYIWVKDDHIKVVDIREEHAS